MSIFSKIKTIKQIFRVDNEYEISLYLNKQPDLNFLTQEYTKAKIAKHRKNMTLLYFFTIIPVGIISCFCFFFGIPWQIYWASENSYFLFYLIGVILFLSFIFLTIVFFIYDFHYIKKKFTILFQKFNELMEKGYLNADLNTYPKCIQMSFFEKQKINWKNQNANSYPIFNYYICMIGLSIFFEKIKSIN